MALKVCTMILCTIIIRGSCATNNNTVLFLTHVRMYVHIFFTILQIAPATLVLCATKIRDAVISFVPTFGAPQILVPAMIIVAFGPLTIVIAWTAPDGRGINASRSATTINVRPMRMPKTVLRACKTFAIVSATADSMSTPTPKHVSSPPPPVRTIAVRSMRSPAMTVV